jgi:hypothetical protein
LFLMFNNANIHTHGDKLLMVETMSHESHVKFRGLALAGLVSKLRMILNHEDYAWKPIQHLTH